MNYQDFRNLQEAYLDVYGDLDEGLKILPREKMKSKAASKRLKATASEIKSKFTTSKGTTERNVVDAKNKRLRSQADKMDKSAAEHTPADAMGKERDNRSRSYGSSNPMGSNEYAERQYAKNRAKLGVKEQADLYDIILSHLLDEGYADTQEAAEAIMVNMSEEWRDDISELYKGKHGQSETEYQAGRSDAGKRVSGDENTGPRHYALGRSARPDAPTKPGEKPKNTPKLANWEKDDIQYRKANLKK
jgi:hypothetical protein